MAHDLERIGLVDHILTGFGVLTEHHEFNAHGIFQTLFVNDNANREFLITDKRSTVEAFAVLDFNDVDVVPTLDDAGFPFGNVARNAVVVGRNQRVTIAEGVVETSVVVVELTLHRVERSDLRDGVLHRLDPTFAVALGIAAVVEGDGFVLEEAVDVGRIEFVLLSLILVGTLVGESPPAPGR